MYVGFPCRVLLFPSENPRRQHNKNINAMHLCHERLIHKQAVISFLKFFLSFISFIHSFIHSFLLLSETETKEQQPVHSCMPKIQTNRIAEMDFKP